MLVDNGLFGDEKSGDGIYTLQASVSPRISLGSKDIPVAVANRKGWLALAKTSLEVKKNPAILEARFQPERALADGRTLVTITVKIDNPGRIEDIQSVSADLRQLRLSERATLMNDGQRGDVSAKDNIWTLQFTLSGAVAPGTYLIPVQVTNLVGGFAVGEAAITVYK
jgi:hypothetical protein